MSSFSNPSSQNSQLSITLKQAIMIQLRYADNLVGAMLTHRSIERLFMRSTRFDLRRLFVGLFLLFLSPFFLEKLLLYIYRLHKTFFFCFLSFYPSIHLSLFISFSLFLSSSVYFSLCFSLSVSLSVCLFLCPFLSLFISLHHRDRPVARVSAEVIQQTAFDAVARNRHAADEERVS